MSTIGTARDASADPGAFHYQLHRPEKTLLYQLVSKHYPVFRQKLAEEGRVLPEYVQREFEDYLKRGRLEHGFLRVRCETCHEERLVAFSCKRRGFCPSCGARRMAEGSDLLVACGRGNPGRRAQEIGTSVRRRPRRYISRPTVTSR